MSVVALLIADLHLSYNPPTARSAEPDWLAAQARPLEQLRALQEKHDCPILCAGDVFDRHNAGPPLVNWAIRCLPKMYAVPGQHDLPHHNLEDVRKSAYWTLVEAGVIEDLVLGEVVDVECDMDRGGGLGLYGYPWGVDLVSVREEEIGLQVAVVHKFVWQKGCGYPGAPEEAKVGQMGGVLRGYDVAVFGDNHHAFSSRLDCCIVWNCGCLIRRKQDERKLRPAVGLLYGDGRVERHLLDTSDDKWIDPVDDGAVADGLEGAGLGEFLEELQGLEADSLDFRDAVRRYVVDHRDVMEEAVGRVLLDVIGG